MASKSYDIMSIKELKEVCKEKDLKQNGKKSELIERINQSDIPVCQPIIPTIEQTKEMFNLIVSILKKCGPKLFLGHKLLKKEHGNRHGSMGTAATEEDIFTTAFRKANIASNANCTQSDIGIIVSDLVLPLSIKALSSISSIAVNWGKNKTKIEFKYIAAIMIIYHKPERVTRSNSSYETGIYMIDPSYCQKNIKLSSNNKSDYIIGNKDIKKMFDYAISSDLFYKIEALKDTNTHFVYRDPDAQTVEVMKKPNSRMLDELRD